MTERFAGKTIMTGKYFNRWFIDGRAYEDYDAVFFDVDGTILSGSSRALPGAVKLFDFLRKNSIAFRLLTNDGNHSIAEKQAFLHNGGLEFDEKDIISCSLPLKDMAEKLFLKGKKAFVMGDLGRPVSYAELAGMIPVEDVKKIDECSCVIAGEGRYDWMKVITSVLNFLIRRGGRAPLIIPNPDTFWPDGKGGYGIGAGAVARFIMGIMAEQKIEQVHYYIGKPYGAIFDKAIKDVISSGSLPAGRSLANNRIIMLGDHIVSDVRGANASGIHSCMLLTGVTKEWQLKDLPESDRPRFVFEALDAE